MKISIITPNYNYGKYIGETIESVLSQNHDNIEHIIVDDGSTDNSVEILSEYALQYPNKIIFIKQENQGQTKAINKALQMAKGDIIGWINSDDYYEPNVLGQIARLFEDAPKLNIVYGNYNKVDVNGLVLRNIKHIPFNYFDAVFVGFGNCITSNAIFWRKRLSDQIGPFNETLLSNMDGEFFSRLTFKQKLMHSHLTIANFRVQNISIAGKSKPNWSRIVKSERNLEYIESYSNLFISKFIHPQLGRLLLYPILVKRKIMKNILYAFKN